MKCSLAFAAGIALILAASSVKAASPQEQAENCAEAAERFRDMFGKPVDGEQPPVVLMYKHTFCPPQLTVRRGGMVRFLNVDKRTSHSFWFRDAGKPESERYFPGEGANVVVDLLPGDHTFLCGPHWEQEGMVGKLTVLP